VLKLLQNILLFLFPIIIMVLIINLKNNNNDQNDYMKAIVNKHYRANKINKPKLIFSGGSNLAFGLDSKKVEKQIGLPVVNMGLHAGLGLDFILKELMDVSKPYDIIVFSPEYSISPDGQYGLKKQTAIHLNKCKKYYSTNISKEISRQINDLRNLIKKPKLSLEEVFSKESIYKSSSFDNYGDINGNKFQDRLLDIGTENLNRSWSSKLKSIKMLKEYASKNKIEIFFLYPSYNLSSYEKNEVEINNYANQIQKELNFNTLGKPIDQVFEDSLFYDYYYHLNNIGRQKRTQKVIKKLKKKMELNL